MIPTSGQMFFLHPVKQGEIYEISADSLHRTELAADSKHEKHEEEENWPERSDWELNDSLGENDKR